MTATILALRALGVGDLLTAVPALRGLRRAFPDDRVVLAAPEPLGGLVELLDAVDELHPTDGLGGLTWRGRPPDIAVNLHDSGPESITDLLRLRPAGLITHRHAACPNVSGAVWRSDLHDAERWCRLLRRHGISADPSDLRLRPPARLSPHGGAVVVHPGASPGDRRWPTDRFARVARELHADGYEIVVSGGPGEVGLARRTARDAGLSDGQVLAGRNRLAETATVVASARLVISGDNGIGRLAAAFSTPSIALFGPRAPSLPGPFPDHRRAVLRSGRDGGLLAVRPAPGPALTEGEVLERARQLLARCR